MSHLIPLRFDVVVVQDLALASVNLELRSPVPADRWMQASFGEATTGVESRVGQRPLVPVTVQTASHR